MKKMLVIFFVMAAVFFIVNAAHSDKSSMGKPLITLPAGTKGDVAFPHGKHQEVLKDCGLCHTMFPKEAGIVQTMKTEEKLRKKQVMNMCIDCHRLKKKDGLPSGPISCSKCHG